MALGLAFHTLAAVLWVGGIFFAHMVLRPSALPLEPPIRLKLWQRAFSRFFPWVWLFIATLLATGFGMVFFGFGGFAAARLYIHLMTGLGLAMVAIFGHLYFAAWPRFRRAVDAPDWPLAAAKLASIRRLVTINLALGIATVLIAGGGRYW
ncbi:MAG: CopD family protein [Rhodomicrobium sp.]